MANQVFPLLTQLSPGVQYFGGARMALLDIQSGFWSIRRQLEALIGVRLTNNVLQQAGVNGGASFAKSLGVATGVKERGRLFESCVQAYQVAGFGNYEIREAHWPIGRVIIRAQDAFEAWMMRQHNHRPDEAVCAYTAGVLVGFVNVISGREDVVCIERHCQALGDEACEFELLPVAEHGKQTVVAFTPDPKLGRQANMLEMLFDRMPMGVAVIDRDFKLVRCNPTWAAFIEQYSPSKAVQVLPGADIFDLQPGSEEVLSPFFEKVFAGETVRRDAVRIESGGIESFWDIVLTPTYEGDQVVGLLNVSIDATERVQVRQTLEQRVDERTRELQMLLDVARAANSSLDLDETLKVTLDLLVNLTEASRAGVMLRFETSGKLEARMIRPEQTIPPEEVAQIMEACEAVAASGEPLYVTPNDKRGFLEPEALLPLRIRDRILGVLVIIGSGSEPFGLERQALFRSIADQLGVAVENARLYGQAEQAAIASERDRLARDLHDAVTQTLFSASLIADVLPKLWERNPDAGKEKLEELKMLTRGALSEMRTLLLELRPAVLIEMDLEDLIRHLANAFTGRTRIPVKLTLEGQADISPEVKDVFYRVAQEALNNIIKHAGASQVFINLRRQENQVEMLILDNGRGFDPQSISPENLGLGIMHERAASIGARLIIKSQVGEGVSIELLWKDGSR
jgi:signal transduction histidine kinase/predicted hydrocarbon binding protein